MLCPSTYGIMVNHLLCTHLPTRLLPPLCIYSILYVKYTLIIHHNTICTETKHYTLMVAFYNWLPEYGPSWAETCKIIIIIMFINCNWVVTRSFCEMRIITRVYLIGFNYNSCVTVHCTNNAKLDIRINSKNIFLKI